MVLRSLVFELGNAGLVALLGAWLLLTGNASSALFIAGSGLLVFTLMMRRSLLLELLAGATADAAEHSLLPSQSGLES